MLKIAKKIARKFRADKNPAPIFFDDDVFLVSYPKSGNTWLRFMVGNYITNCALDFTNSHLLLPAIQFIPEKCEEVDLRPRFIKSHMPYTAQYPKVVYIVRDGRDVAVSYYFYLQKMSQLQRDTPFSVFLKKFATSGISEYGTWSSHVDSWTKELHPHVMVVKYEDMLLNAENQLERVLRFAEVDYDMTKVEAAVEASKFDKMQHLEIREYEGHFSNYGSDFKEIQFVRKGKSGDWKNYFSKEDENFFIAEHGSLLEKYGYI